MTYSIGMRGADFAFHMGYQSLTNRQRNALNALRSCRMERSYPRVAGQHNELLRSGFIFHCHLPDGDIYSNTTRMAVVTDKRMFLMRRPSNDTSIPIAGIYEKGNWR